MSYTHVLAAVDVSADCAQVLEKAKTAAAHHNAGLSVVTVIKPLHHNYGYGIDSSGFIGFEHEAQEQARATLSELAPAYGIGADRIHVETGQPADKIRETADRINADLIVVGTHGRYGLGRLLGSTACGVLHGVERDVLAVRVADE